ncbi:MAG: hypothetical protein M4579_005542 [Chaenotheca gracillima]|nr:MAG: hypothetical protein M4579_005542 [Chaenotheca gracillima]
MSSDTLFTLPVAPAGAVTKSGSITCTRPFAQQQNIYLLTFTYAPDNRLTPPFCAALLLALDIIQYRYPPGVVITTSGIPKFYSNGLDYENASGDKAFWAGSLWPLYRRFLTYPMPTIALMNGHAFAGGLMLAMHHDYRLFNPSRGFLCLNELEFGASLHPPMATIFRIKLPSPATYRSLVLESKRFKAQEALAEGLVDALAEKVEEVLKFVDERGLTKKGEKGSYGLLKAEIWREGIQDLEGHAEAESKRSKDLSGDEVRRKESVQRVEAWEKGRDKAKI